MSDDPKDPEGMWFFVDAKHLKLKKYAKWRKKFFSLLPEEIRFKEKNCGIKYICVNGCGVINIKDMEKAMGLDDPTLVCSKCGCCRWYILPMIYLKEDKTPPTEPRFKYTKKIDGRCYIEVSLVRALLAINKQESSKEPV